MRPSHNLLLLLNLLGATQSLLLACALFGTKRGQRVTNRLLAAFAATIALSISGEALSATQYIQMFPHLSKIPQPFYFLGAPLLFLYVRSLISGNPVFERKDLLHFIPFGLCAIYLMPYYLQSGPDKLNYRAGYSAAYGVQWYGLRSGALLLQFLIYLTLIILMLVGSRRRAQAGGPMMAQTVLFQIRFLLITFLSLWVIGVLHYLTSLLSHAYYKTPETDLFIPLGLTAFVYALAYLSLRKPEVLTATGEMAPPKKYEKSGLPPEISERYVRKLLRFMDTDKPYTDSELTLSKLAEKLSIPAQHLSRVINERLHQNFVDFINTYRVEEAKRRLVDPLKKHYSILAIAEEAGFNSKSSFNHVFKKHANLTPSEFRKADRQGLEKF
jgi:AraC-like DNA-binding protein